MNTREHFKAKFAEWETENLRGLVKDYREWIGDHGYHMLSTTERTEYEAAQEVLER